MRLLLGHYVGHSVLMNTGQIGKIVSVNAGLNLLAIKLGDNVHNYPATDFVDESGSQHHNRQSAIIQRRDKDGSV